MVPLDGTRNQELSPVDNAGPTMPVSFNSRYVIEDLVTRANTLEIGPSLRYSDITSRPVTVDFAPGS